MTRPLRVAQLSFWFIHAEQFCLAAREAPGVELIAVWDDVQARGRRAAARHGVEFEPDVEALLDRDDLDAVSLCAEPHRNAELAVRAAQAGKHLLIEKPMAADLEGARQVVNAVEAAGVQAMPAYNLRFHPVSLWIKELVDSGVLGTLARVRRWHGHSLAYERGCFDGPTIAARLGWGDPVQEKRNSLFFAGAHSALWYCWMFGPPKSVQCMTGTITRELPVEDNSVVSLRYPGGLIATMESSETLVAQQAVAEIYGTEGALVQLRGNLPSTRVWNRSATPVWHFSREREEWSAPALPPQFLRHESVYGPVGQFFTALQEGRDVPTTVRDGYDSIALLVAAEQAAELGREVDLVRYDGVPRQEAGGERSHLAGGPWEKPSGSER